MFSMSNGDNTWRCKIKFFKFGANSERVFTTASPNASRCASFQPPLILYGAYCTKILMTCFPGGAMLGSIVVGIKTSMYGLREKHPYFASSYARSIYSMLGEISIMPCSKPLSCIAVKFGRPSSARFTLPDEPRNLNLRIAATKSSGKSFSFKNF